MTQVIVAKRRHRACGEIMLIDERLTALKNKILELRYRDKVSLNDIESQLRMIIHRVYGEKSHYLQQLDSIHYYPSVGPTSDDYHRRIWMEGVGQLHNLLNTVIDDRALFNSKSDSLENAQRDLKAINESKSRILFLSADPSNESRLRLGEEMREISTNLQLSQLRDNFTLETMTSVRPVDLSQAMLDKKPNIVHFSGHGTIHGALCFENNQGITQAIEPQALQALFELFSDHVSCVLLNACYSEKQAEAIAQNIPFVIGMNGAIGDRAAIAFAVGFYQAIGAGMTIEKAYHMGKVQIMLNGIPEHLTPKLISNKQIADKNDALEK
jgi:hypothetical protein